MRPRLAISVLLLATMFASEAAARDCWSVWCAMCARRYGALPGYALVNGRVVRTVQRSAPTVQRSAPVPAIQRPAPTQKPDLTLDSTPQPLVGAILDVIGIRPGDVFCDPGCGDGRFLKAAIERGAAAAIGVELGPVKAALARQLLKETPQAVVIEADASKISLAPFDVTVMYLFPSSMPSVETAKPGAVVVSINHPIPGVTARKATIEADGESCTIYVFRVPT